VKELRQKHPNVRVLVQPCQRRVFPPQAYEQAGAVLTNDLQSADLILGVKRPADVGLLWPNKTYMVFSHTIKGQPENMSLLQACLDNDIQLMDYECLLDNSNDSGAPNKPQRLVSFGRFAGLAGAMDTLHGVGRRLLAEGQSTPWLACPPAVLCDDLAHAQERVHQIGQRLLVNYQNKSADQNQQQQQQPLVIGITGKGGSVHGGVMEMLDLLPHEVVSVADLPHLFSTESMNSSQQDVTIPHDSPLYLVPMATNESFQKADGSFDRTDFQTNPSLYTSTLPTKVIPYMDVLINCAYWDPRFPRLLTKQNMCTLYNNGHKK
jgi:alpha-aminoadipic semialdehyde synthase